AGTAGTRDRSVPPKPKGARFSSIHIDAMVAGSGVKPAPVTVTAMMAMPTMRASATPSTVATASSALRKRCIADWLNRGRGVPRGGTDCKVRGAVAVVMEEDAGDAAPA